MRLFYLVKYKDMLLGKSRDVEISGKLTVTTPSKVNLGRGIYFGPNFLMMNLGEVKISDNVIFGPNVTLIDYNHDFNDVEFMPYGPANIVKPIVIEENVWVGFGVIILPGTRLKSGVIVAAGSVVRGNTESNTIYAGNPAKVVGARSNRSGNFGKYMFDKLRIDEGNL